MKFAALVLGFWALASSATAATPWKAVDAENVLVIDSSRGRILVELHPEMAPNAVARIKLLARRGTYDGLQFWRVLPGFVAQTGDPGNHDGGKTELPNLAPEFTFKLSDDIPHTVVARPQGLSEGFIGAMPYVAAQPLKPGPARAWGSYCTGVMGMGRDEPLDSANAEIFFMLAAVPRLDRDYTAVGQVIAGQTVLNKLNSGEPAPNADIVTHVQILADLKAAPKVEIMDTQSRAFRHLVSRARARKGADFSICDVSVPVRVRP